MHRTVAPRIAKPDYWTMMPTRRHMQRCKRARPAFLFRGSGTKPYRRHGLRNAGKRRFFDHTRLAQGGQGSRNAVPCRRTRSATPCHPADMRNRATGSKFHIRATVSKCHGAGESRDIFGGARLCMNVGMVPLQRRAPLHAAIAREPRERQLPARVSDAAAWACRSCCTR
ncbi:hypothetical protein HPB51_019217 [Rhipicephalus microplus]|uniref:Uncharacterized protein n=1 Tax=Rhipicephalus microplus TaxID=6941 RepID=A0A9J6DC03_RHIMP|nr:hypothetical protein HPB51_019217 [Rhipicephalus microplus]